MFLILMGVALLAATLNGTLSGMENATSHPLVPPGQEIYHSWQEQRGQEVITAPMPNVQSVPPSPRRCGILEQLVEGSLAQEKVSPGALSSRTEIFLTREPAVAHHRYDPMVIDYDRMEQERESDVCTICLVRIERDNDSLSDDGGMKNGLVFLTCGTKQKPHAFHPKCLESWVTSQKGERSCPNCRQPVNYQVTSKPQIATSGFDTNKCVCFVVYLIRASLFDYLLKACIR